MLTSYVIDHDMNLQILVQILLGYLQPVHLGGQSHLILCLEHHQSPFVSYVYFEKTSKDACLLAMIHSVLVNS